MILIPQHGDSSIRLTVQLTVPERKCLCMLVRVAGEMARVNEVERKTHGPRHYSNDVVRVKIEGKGPKITITTSHWKWLWHTVLLPATAGTLTSSV